jgi:hypothetical protein
MKMNLTQFPILLTAVLATCLSAANAQSTDGKVSFSVQTTAYTAKYNPDNVAAVWVVDSNGNFIKTLCRHANSKIGYLAKWIASRGSYLTVDGVTSATTTNPQTHNVTWDCRNTNGVVVADGAYTFRAEYTSINGQGPYLSNVCVFVKGASVVSTNYPAFSNGGGSFQNMALAYTNYAEVAVTNLSPASGLINSSVPVVVSVTNQTLNALSFSVAVSNVTSGTLIGTQPVTALAGRAITNMTFSWSTAGLLANPYQIRAVASKLATETNTVNNVLTRTITLSLPESGDIGVLSLTPASGIVNASQSMQVRVTNVMSSAAGPFTVALSNVTAGATWIASRPITLLAGRAATNISLTWSTAGLPPGTYQVKASATPLTNETNTADNSLSAPVALRDAIHDLAVRSVSLAAMVPPNVTTNVVVAVTNRGDLAETFTNTLRDVTATPVIIGTRVVTNLAAFAGTNLVFAWNTATNATFKLGYHFLQHGIAPVPGEADLVNNTNQIAAIVASSLTTNTLVAKSAAWKVLDKGLDISGAPWLTTDYYDGFWSAGAAPLGYGLANIATAIGYGGVSSNRYTTTYFRREFTMDFTPMTLTGRMMRAHGAVLYLNGTEIARQNMPAGDVAYATCASNAVAGEAATNYYGFVVPPAALVVGRNLMTAELHLAAGTNTTAGFAVELITVNPTIPPTYTFTPSALTPDGASQSGDASGVTVTLSNSGNATASCLVLIKDGATGSVLGSQTVGPLTPGEIVTVRILLTTIGAATGNRTLQAFTVVNNVTNLTTVATAPFTLSASDFAPRSVAAAGSIGGRCNAVAVSGRYVYLGCGATLEVWDAIVPAAPVRLGAIRLPGIIENLAASNNWVYAAAGASGVHMVDASTPAQLLHRATFDSSGFARRVTLAGNLLYVADVIGGVRILNVSNPAAPILSGAYQTTGPAQAIAFTSPRLLVLDSYYGLQNLHAANPAAMTVTGMLSQVTAGLAITAVPGAALVADGNAGLCRINLTTPASPSIATNTLLPAAGSGLATSASGTALYVAAGSAGLLTLNASTLASQATTSVGGEACDVAVAGDTLYVAAGFAGCRSLDISAPLAPLPLAVYATGARPVDVAAVGSKLIVAADESGLQVYSLENLALPGLLATVSSISNSRCVEVAYPYAYVGDGSYGLKILDIANASAPTVVGTYPATGLSHIRRIAVAGTRAVITDGRALQLLSLANRAAPALLATVANTPGSFVFDVVAVSNEVYAACGNAGVRIYGMDNNLNLDGTYATPGPATGLTSVSNLLHVSCGPSGWLTLSIAVNPVSPVLIKVNATGKAFGAAAAGPLVYLTDGARVGQAFNASVPLTPTPVTNVTLLTHAMRLRAAGGLILAAEDEAGLAILNASPGDINLDGIPDAWEQQIVNASTATNGPVRSILDVNPQAIGPNRFPYYQSYLAGLSPTDPNSVLAISAVTQVSGGGQFVVRWFSVTGKKYTLYKSTDLAAGFAPIPSATDIVAAGDSTSYTDTVSTVKAFYTVVVIP